MPEPTSTVRTNLITPLHSAATSSRNPDVPALLLHAGADVNAKDWAGFTPLHCAYVNSNPEVIRVLPNAGANANAVDVDGKLPLEYAEENEALKGLTRLAFA